MILNPKVKKYIIRAIFLSFLFIVIWFFYQTQSPGKGDISFGDNGYVQIGDIRIDVEIANTNSSRATGLSGRKSLAENSGMLFLFDLKGLYSFWMPDMYFPIDIIWILDGVIVGVEHNVSNEFDMNNPVYYYSPEDVNMVLEVNAGFVNTKGIQIGDRIEIFNNQ